MARLLVVYTWTACDRVRGSIYPLGEVEKATKNQAAW